jgi:hypothetical protein
MPTTRAELKEALIEQLKRSVNAGDTLPYRRELDGDRAAQAIDLFLERMADLPPDTEMWQAVRDHLQNAIIGCKLFDKDDDVQLQVNSDPSEYTITASINLGAGTDLICAGGDTPEIALERLRTRIHTLFNDRRDTQP